MAAGISFDKQALAELATVPRMIGDTDVALIRSYAQTIPDGSLILEFGPWLGGVTMVLAEYGRVEVIDRFEWSEQNNEAFPGLGKVGKSFRPLFERLMAGNNVEVTVHETTFRDFTWDGRKVGFCFIDGPRSPHDLLSCLVPLCDALGPEARLLIKHGANPEHLDLMALIEVLAGKGYFEIVESQHPRWCNIAVLKPGPRIAELAGFDFNDMTFDETPPAAGITDPWGGPLYTLARLAQLLQADKWTRAYSQLRYFPADAEYLYGWDRFENHLGLPTSVEPLLAAFSEILSAQALPAAAPLPPGRSLGWALRAWWTNTAGKPWQASSFDPLLLSDAFEAHAMDWPARLLPDIIDRNVVEIGADLGLSGVGYATAGCARYLGLETDSLTATTRRLNAEFAPVQYTKIDMVESAPVETAAICLIHEEVKEIPGLQEAVQHIRAKTAGTLETWLLPERGTRPRRLKI